MADEILQKVTKLQARLQRNTKPRKLLKNIERLGELPMTVDILVETGVRRTVKAFRKHEAFGEVAKNLVARWKQLVHQSVHRPTNSHVRKSCSSKVGKTNGTPSTKRPSSSNNPAAAPPAKRQRVVEDVIPLPVMEPQFRPLASIDITPMSHQVQKGLVCNSEEDAEFTGKRINSRTPVYSGSKTSFLPRTMTSQEQCIRELQNNIDSIAEVGGVSFETLKPVLERCTTEQLHRIEQSNQWIKEDSDELWMRHCRREFRRESPQECKSWREMYPRQHKEREERLRLLTQRISSAYANKSKGREVKMAFMTSDAKPPRDVRS